MRCSMPPRSVPAAGARRSERPGCGRPICQGPRCGCHRRRPGRGHAPSLSPPGVDARQAAVEQLPFDDSFFDALVAGFLLNHLARPFTGVAEMARVCRGLVA
ncbi:MAG: methyltransferase domain-containing protein [Acidimicrobiales bacterium]